VPNNIVSTINHPVPVDYDGSETINLGADEETDSEHEPSVVQISGVQSNQPGQARLSGKCPFQG
jgi:hypothetical protein